MRKWQCLVCGFIYDEAKGLPEEGIPPGTSWMIFQTIGNVLNVELAKKILK